MQEHTIDKQQMDALMALSSTNLKVSEARNSLVKLQELETKYLISREKKAMERIQIALQNSQEVVEQISKNYEKVTEFSKTIENGADLLASAYEAFRLLLESFSSNQKLWEQDVKSQEETLVRIKNASKIDTVVIDGKNKALDERVVKLKDLQRKIDDDRGTLDRAINRLKGGRI